MENEKLSSSPLNFDCCLLLASPTPVNFINRARLSCQCDTNIQATDRQLYFTKKKKKIEKMRKVKKKERNDLQLY